MKTVAFISEGCLPIPPIKGGAVGELVQCLVNENRKRKLYDFSVYSIFDDSFSNNSEEEYRYIKTSKLASWIDHLLFGIAKTLKFSTSEKFRYIFQRIDYLIKLWFELKKTHFDYVILEANTTLLIYVHLLKSRGSKVIFHLHNDVPTIYGRKKEVNNLDMLIGNSNYVLENFITTYSINPDINKYVLKNCIANFDFSESNTDLRDLYGISKNANVVLYVGRLTEQKGVVELINAHSRTNTDSVLLIVGSPMFGLNVTNEYLQKMDDAIMKSKKRTILAGYIPHDYLATYYSQSTVSVFPSLYGEAAGLTIIEAISNRARVITTGVGGICEYIKQNEAVVVPVGDDFEQRLANAIDSQVSDNVNFDNREPIADRIRTDYSPSVFYDSFVRILGEI